MAAESVSFLVRKGLPPDGTPGTFLGWSADHKVWLVRWQAVGFTPVPYWYALGFDGRDYPVGRLLSGDDADLILITTTEPLT